MTTLANRLSNNYLSTVYNRNSAQCGLILKTYQSDIFNNWINSNWIDGENGISAITAISTNGDKFTIDQLNLSKKVYDMLNRIAVSGGTYQDWVETVYTSTWNMHTETPVYEGGMSAEIIFYTSLVFLFHLVQCQYHLIFLFSPFDFVISFNFPSMSTLMMKLYCLLSGLLFL